MRHHDPTRILYQDYGANLYNIIPTPNNHLPTDDNCLAAKAVYDIYADGRWISVESEFTDNFDPNAPDKRNRCLWYTPDVCTTDVADYPCPPPVMALPRPSAPQMTRVGANTLRVDWSVPKSCLLPTTPEHVCDSFHNQCAPLGQVCVFGSEGLQGYCQPPNPQDCSAPGSSCSTGFECQARDAEFEGYYLYLDDWKANTVLTDLDYHVRGPAAAVAKEKSSLSHTFSGLAFGSPANERRFSARIATFDRSGRISDPSPPSSVEVPDPSSDSVPPPTGVRTVIWVTRNPVTGRDGIEVKWQPGKSYTPPASVSYRLWRSESPYGPFCALTGGGVAGPPVCKSAAVLGASEVTTSWKMYIDDSADQGITYHYRVTALDGTVESVPSEIVSGMVLPHDTGRLSVPESLQAVAANGLPVSGPPQEHTGIYLHWCPNPTVEGVTGYRIYRSQTSGGPYRPGTTTHIATVPPECLDMRHRCEITTATMANPTTLISSNTNCQRGTGGTCQIVDTTIGLTPANTTLVYYYAVTAIRDSAGVLTESPFSLENQGRPNYFTGTEYVAPYDPDNTKELVCGVDRAELRVEPQDSVAPYRVIGQSPPGPPSPNAVPRFLFSHLDHLGTPRVITTDTGTVVSSHHYLPFGEEAPWVAQATTNLNQFTGHERDPETGLDYMLARYYSSSLGRFLAPDQRQPSLKHLLLPQRWNKYAYVRNNPLALVDPDGFDDFVVFDMFQAKDFPTGYQRPDWGAIQSAAARNGHNVRVVPAGSQTPGSLGAATGTPGANVVVAGHTAEPSPTTAAGVVTPAGVVGSGVAVPGVPTVSPGPASAASVNIFGCNSASLDGQYSGAGSFTGVNSGADGTSAVALEEAAATFVSTATSTPDVPYTPVDLAPAASASGDVIGNSNVRTPEPGGANVDRGDTVVRRQ